MVWDGWDLKAHPVPPPAMGTTPRAPPMALGTAGMEHRSSGQQCQCLTTLIMKILFLMSDLNILSDSLDLFPLVLSLNSLTKSPSVLVLQPLNELEGHMRSAQTLLFSKLNSHNCQPVSIAEVLRPLSIMSACVQYLIHQEPQVLLMVAHNPPIAQPVLGIALTEVQHYAPGLVEPQAVHPTPPLGPGQVSRNGIPSFHPSHHAAGCHQKSRTWEVPSCEDTTPT